MGLQNRIGTRNASALGLRVFYAVSRAPGSSARQIADEIAEQVRYVSARLSDLRNSGLLRSDMDVNSQTLRWYVNVKARRGR